MSTGARAYDFDAEEAAYDQLYQTTPITLTGRIADEAGYPLKHAQVTLIAWGESSANHGATGSAQAGGFFTMPGMARRAALLRISRSGYYTELIPVDLQKPLGETSVDVGTIVLTARRTGRTRLIFAGDTMMARRYIDDDGDGIVGEPTDLIHPGTAETDTIALFRYVRDVLENDDLTVVNLETAVTANPVTPHPTKSHVFYTLPDSLLAFPQVGIESVTIGNNHVYDFLEAGMFDTLAAIDAAGLDWFGAGMDETEARANRYYTSPGGVDLAFQGFNELIGTNYGGPDLYIVALDNPFAKGGALALNIATITEFVDDEAATRFAIPVMHGGTEYVSQQPGPMRDDFRLAIDRGAGFVVAHHPHYAHGVAVYDGGMGPRFIFSSLGNFVFDQGFFETARSYLAMVDIDWHPGGAQVSRVRLVPFRQDRFIPRLLVGHGLDRMGRFLGHLSTQAAEPGDGITGATVFAEGGRIVALASAAEALVEEAQESRQAPVTNGFTDVIPFESYSPGDSLAQVVAATSSTCQVGRDLLWTGDFEEEDVDAHYHEGDRWLTATSRYLQNSVVHSGSGAAVLLRLDSSPGYTALSTENTIRVTPDGTLSITGFVKGDNAGLFEIVVRQLDSNGGVVLYDTMYQRSASTYDWSRFTTTFILAPGTTAIRIDLRASPPAAGEGRVFLDDIAIVEWNGQTYDGDQGFSLATPNQWDYLRCHASGEVSTLGLDLLHRSYASR